MSEARKQVSFPLNFSKITELCQNPIQENADTLWHTIEKPGEPCKYTTLLNRIRTCTNKTHILEGFGLSPQSDSILSEELRRHLTYISNILPAEPLRTLFRELVVRLENLTSLLNSDQQTLLQLAMNLLWNSLAFFDDNESRVLIMKRFAESLVPEAFRAEFDDTSRSYLKFVTFLPLDESHGRTWIALEADRVTLHVFTTEPQDAIKHETHQIGELMCNVFSTEITFSEPGHPGAVMTFNLESDDAGLVWKDAVEVRDADPLLCFVQCLPYAVPRMGSAPAELKQCIQTLFSAPDNDFAIAIAQAAAAKGHEAWGTIGAVLSLLQRYNLIPGYFRQLFGDYVFAMKTTTTIFRENSALMTSCSVFLGEAEKDYGAMVVEKLSQNRETVRDGVNAIHALAGGVGAQMCFLLSTAFHSVRRRFSDTILPLMGASSIAMLRFLLPKFSLANPSENTQPGQKLMKAFVFSRNADLALEDEDFVHIAEYIITACREVDGVCNFPVNGNDEETVLRFCESSEELSQYLYERISSRTCHPFMWALLKVLERIVFGTNEDFQAMILNGELAA